MYIREIHDCVYIDTIKYSYKIRIILNKFDFVCLQQEIVLMYITIDLSTNIHVLKIAAL